MPMGNIFHVKPPSKRARIRLKMATARLRAYIWEGETAEPLEGFAFIADFSEDGIGLYIEKKLRVTGFVRVSFESRESSPFRTRVAWSERFALEQKFIGHDSLSYRAGLQFVFGSEDERQRYLGYFNELRERVKILSGEKA